ncbi:MAG TPA: pseudouridine synthase, partial [Coleofasciculaceae cyanobacterium]
MSASWMDESNDFLDDPAADVDEGSDPTTYDCSVDRSERLDRFLAATWPNLSRSRFQKLIEAGQVALNGAPCTNKHTDVKPGDQVTVSIPPDRPLSLEPQAIPLDILYEDAQVIVVNKPAGMVVHPAPGHADGTMVNALLAHCQTLPGMEMPSINGVQRPGVVHRLDRDTTGAIMFAKTDLANQHLQAQLRYKVAQRTYLGIVYGAPQRDRGIVDLPLGRHPVDR